MLVPGSAGSARCDAMHCPWLHTCPPATPLPAATACGKSTGSHPVAHSTKAAQPAPTRPGLAPVNVRICPTAASFASFCCSGLCGRQTGPGWHSWVIAMLRPRAAALGGAEPVWYVVHSAAWLAVETCLASADHRSTYFRSTQQQRTPHHGRGEDKESAQTSDNGRHAIVLTPLMMG